MVLYSEQNYEGFKEGLNMASVTNIDTTVIGHYGKGDTMIHVIDDSAIHNSGTGEYSITMKNGGAAFIDNTIITKDEPSIMIETTPQVTTTGHDIDFTIKSILTTLIATADATTADATAAATANAATGAIVVDTAVVDAAAATAATAVVDAWAATTSVVATGKCSIFNIGNDSIIRASSLAIMEATDISALFDADKTYLLTIGMSDYEINIVRSSILTLSTGLETSLDHGADVIITKHSHPHGHTVEAMDGEKDDEKDDDETNDAVKNIMDKLDIDGIIDIVKKGSDKKEGFFSGEKESGGEVVGAFAGESYESEITGVAECTTTICERIHREEQLIRPVNSNEELQRV
jgi:hypothetical protein